MAAGNKRWTTLAGLAGDKLDIVGNFVVHVLGASIPSKGKGRKLCGLAYPYPGDLHRMDPWMAPTHRSYEIVRCVLSKPYPIAIAC